MILLILACAEEGCDPSLLAVNRVSATIDGELWESNAAWSVAGSAVQLTTDADGWRISMVLYDSVTGTPAGELEGEGPWTFPLTSGTDGGFALLYPEGASTLSSENGDGGNIEVWVDEQDWLGCFDFEVGDADGVSVSVSGSVRAAAP